MKKTTKRDFARFKKLFKEYVQFFGLTQWQISFHHKPMVDTLASVEFDLSGKFAQVTLTTEYDSGHLDSATDDVVHFAAKHEAIHLTLGELTVMAQRRFVNQQDLEDAEEGIVRIFEKIIP